MTMGSGCKEFKEVLTQQRISNKKDYVISLFNADLDSR